MSHHSSQRHETQMMQVSQAKEFRRRVEFSGEGVYTVAHVSDLEKELFMPIKKELLEILACPACHGDIVHDTAKDTLNCTSCRRRYPIKDDIPVMLVDEATIPDEGEGQKKP